MTPAEAQALEDVHGYTLANRVEIQGHAWKRMRERGAKREDVRSALVTAKDCQAEPEVRGEARWKVAGVDTAGDALDVVVELVDGVIVVTLF